MSYFKTERVEWMLAEARSGARFYVRLRAELAQHRQDLVKQAEEAKERCDRAYERVRTASRAEKEVVLARNAEEAERWQEEIEAFDMGVEEDNCRRVWWEIDREALDKLTKVEVLRAFQPGDADLLQFDAQINMMNEEEHGEGNGDGEEEDDLIFLQPRDDERALAGARPAEVLMQLDMQSQSQSLVSTTDNDNKPDSMPRKYVKVLLQSPASQCVQLSAMIAAQEIQFLPMCILHIYRRLVLHNPVLSNTDASTLVTVIDTLFMHHDSDPAHVAIACNTIDRVAHQVEDPAQLMVVMDHMNSSLTYATPPLPFWCTRFVLDASSRMIVLLAKRLANPPASSYDASKDRYAALEQGRRTIQKRKWLDTRRVILSHESLAAQARVMGLAASRGAVAAFHDPEAFAEFCVAVATVVAVHPEWCQEELHVHQVELTPADPFYMHAEREDNSLATRHARRRQKEKEREKERLAKHKWNLMDGINMSRQDSVQSLSEDKPADGQPDADATGAEGGDANAASKDAEAAAVAAAKQQEEEAKRPYFAQGSDIVPDSWASTADAEADVNHLHAAMHLTTASTIDAHGPEFTMIMIVLRGLEVFGSHHCIISQPVAAQSTAACLYLLLHYINARRRILEGQHAHEETRARRLARQAAIEAASRRGREAAKKEEERRRSQMRNPSLAPPRKSSAGGDESDERDAADGLGEEKDSLTTTLQEGKAGHQTHHIHSHKHKHQKQKSGRHSIKGAGAEQESELLADGSNDPLLDHQAYDEIGLGLGGLLPPILGARFCLTAVHAKGYGATSVARALFEFFLEAMHVHTHDPMVTYRAFYILLSLLLPLADIAQLDAAGIQGTTKARARGLGAMQAVPSANFDDDVDGVDADGFFTGGGLPQPFANLSSTRPSPNLLRTMSSLTRFQFRNSSLASFQEQVEPAGHGAGVRRTDSNAPNPGSNNPSPAKPAQESQAESAGSPDSVGTTGPAPPASDNGGFFHAKLHRSQTTAARDEVREHMLAKSSSVILGGGDSVTDSTGAGTMSRSSSNRHGKTPMHSRLGANSVAQVSRSQEHSVASSTQVNSMGYRPGVAASARPDSAAHDTSDRPDTAGTVGSNASAENGSKKSGFSSAADYDDSVRTLRAVMDGMEHHSRLCSILALGLMIVRRLLDKSKTALQYFLSHGGPRTLFRLTREQLQSGIVVEQLTALVIELSHGDDVMAEAFEEASGVEVLNRAARLTSLIPHASAMCRAAVRLIDRGV